MKHTAPYPHQRHQNLARLLLTIWLFTICSPEATCSPAASQPEQVVSAAASTNFCPPGLPGPDTAPSNASQLPLEAALQQMPPDSFLDEKNENKFYKEMGELAWQQAMDCDDALQEQWDQLTILKREDLAPLSADQLKALRLKYASQAHEFYRSSCQEAAKAQDLSSETDLKVIMAEHLLTLGYPLEAKIYVLNILLRLKSASSDIEVGALRRAQALLVEVEEAQPASPDGQTATNSPTNTLSTLQKAKMYVLNILLRLKSTYSDIKVGALRGGQALLARVEEAQPACADGKTATSSPTNTLSTTLQRLNECSEQSSTETQENYADLKIQVQWAAAQDLREIALKLLLSVYEPTSPPVPEATISSIQKSAKRYKQTARNTIIVGGLGILAIVGGLCTWMVREIAAVPKLLESDVNTVIRPIKDKIKNNAKILLLVVAWAFCDLCSRFGWAMVYAYMALGTNYFLIALGEEAVVTYALPLWKEGERKRQYAVSCSTLNLSIAEALEAYRQGNIQRCLDMLSTEYAKNQRLRSPQSSYPPRYYISENLPHDALGPYFMALLITIPIGKVLLRGLKTLSYSLSCWQWKARENFQYALRLVNLELNKLAQRRNQRVIESLIDLMNGYRQTWERFCELANDAWEEFKEVLFEELESTFNMGIGDSIGITEIMEKWWRLIIAKLEATEDAQEMPSAESLETVRKIVSMNRPTANMNRPTTKMQITNTYKKYLADQLVKAACDAMKHYLQLQSNRSEADSMSPLRLAAITDLANACASSP